jgi:carboxypeptidase Q
MAPLLLLALLQPVEARKPKKAPPAPDMEAVSAELLGKALASSDAYEELRELCDDIGHRFSGSPQLDKAIDWAAEEMRQDGLQVTLEPVEIRRWVRGPATLELLAPRPAPLTIMALGGTVSTPAEGIEADVLVVDDFDELEARSEEAKGRIVVYDRPFTTYGETVRYRWDGANQAAKHGAVASLVRSVTDHSLHTLHTGGMGYEDEGPKIPHAAITVESATMLHRMQEAGTTPRLRMVMEAKDEEPVRSHNVVGEVRGRENPEQIVVLGCHLDSWDVGQGAQDDGAGCVTVMAAGALLQSLDVAPRRTVRVVLYTNEENGLAGGKAYAEAHQDERIVAAIEDDTGAGTPHGWRVHGPDSDNPAESVRGPQIIEALRPYVEPLSTLGSETLRPAWSGADIGPLLASGTVGFGLDHDMTEYWWIHHTEADTFEKVDPDNVRRSVATMTLMAWALAEMPTPVDEVGK